MIRIFRRKKSGEKKRVDDPERAAALVREADARCDGYEYEEAMKLYEAAAEAGAGSGAYAMYVMLLARMEDPEKALELADRLISEEPDNGIAYAARETALARQSLHAEAVEDFIAAARKDPKPKEIYCEMGFSFSALGRREEAVEAYRRSVELRPDDADSIYGLCSELENLGRYGEALDMLKEKRGRETRNRQIHMHLGRVYGKLGDWKNAYANHVEAVWLRPHDEDESLSRHAMKLDRTISSIRERAEAAEPGADSLSDLASRLRDIGWDDNALYALDTATRMKPNYSDYMTMAEICADRYYLHSAIKHLESALGSLGKDPDPDRLETAYGRLVKFSFECGLYRKVLDHSGRALRLGVKNKDVRKCREKVLSKHGENPEDLDQVSDGWTHPDWL